MQVLCGFHHIYDKRRFTSNIGITFYVLFQEGEEEGEDMEEDYENEQDEAMSDNEATGTQDTVVIVGEWSDTFLKYYKRNFKFDISLFLIFVSLLM